jgi:two-component system CheB/CheR fusion protein
MLSTGRRLIADAGFAVAMVTCVVIARFLADPWLGDSVAYLPAILGVAAAARFRGLVSAFITLPLALVACNFFFVEPRFTLSVSALHEEGFRIGAVALIGIAVGVWTSRDNLRRKSDELVAVMDFVPVAMWVAHDANASRLTRNRAAGRLFRLPENARADARFYGERFRLTPVGRRDEPLDSPQLPLQRAARGETVHGEEYDALFADGAVRSVLVNAAPIRDERGAIRGAVATFADLTAHREAEEQVRAAHARIASVLETMTDAFCAFDADWRFSYLNPRAERYLRSGDAPLLGAILWQRFPMLADSTIAMTMRRARDERRTVSCEAQVPGTARWIELRAHPWEDGVAIYFRDITERRSAAGRIVQLNAELQQRVAELEHAESALLDADRRKDEFLALLAHELRNPLAPVQNAAYILASPKAPAEMAGRAIGIVQRQVRHMSRLVDDLLDISRITRGKINIQRERVSLASVLGDAIETSRPGFEEAGHTLDVALPDDTLEVDGDRTRLAQVFLNLLNNAAKYTPHGGRVTVRATREGGQVVVRVTDTGIGIPAENLARIFEPFWQVDPSVTRAHGGLGIGLTLVERLVKLHGGTVEAHSDGPGRGSEFVVRLPVPQHLAPAAHVAPADGASAIPAPRMAPGQASYRILVADDNLDALDSLITLLALRGHTVVGRATDGVQALAETERTLPDVVLLDIGMPRMDGYEAARRIRRTAHGKTVTLVAITGWGQPSDVARARNAGFDHHLTKPVSPEELERILARPVEAVT